MTKYRPGEKHRCSTCSEEMFDKLDKEDHEKRCN